MAASMSVQILCPNGRRQTVKISSNTKLLQVLEEVCQKQGFSAQEYDLKHQRTILDLSVPVRYANLTNNAKLEMVKSTKARAEADVNICLQLESGERLKHPFPPATNLWDVVRHFETQPGSPHAGKLTSASAADIHPVCVYMREEIIGESALQSTSLRNLGLTSGSAILRLVHRKVDDPSLLHTSSAPVAKPMRVTGSKSEPTRQSVPSTSTHNVPMTSKSSDAQPMEVEETRPVQSVESMDTSHGPTEQEIEAMSQEEILQRLSPQERQVVDTMSSMIQQAYVQRPQPHTQAPVAPQQASQGPSKPKKARSTTRPQQPATKQPSFADFKFPEASRGQEVYVNELSEVDRRNVEPCEREPVVFSLDMMEGAQQSEDPTDDFFEVTVNDVRHMMADLSRARREMEDETMMTGAMRAQREVEMIQKYPKTVIRVQFPDRTVLQGFFRPMETVPALTEFVKSNLADPTSPFYLYTTPPRYVLDKPSMTLYQAKLFPAVVVHFGSEVHRERYLKPEMLSTASAPLDADRVATRDKVQTSSDGARGVSESAAAPPRPRQQVFPAPEGGARAGQARGQQDGKKVPKWFKMGK
ncbi:tether containing UBX domain for GLUT4-like isoform X1 [Branchiostoma floridae]|uniref:Tether containing UBX domain for GLUT4-like isoform X1 n=1 Tax=Branchiostoma floridae TaxID=7739 RepID=A0A9J7M669_BRAFL|nr:tether containing UBX domain for GLUT4-like isoform X1 [Branchiostoma floridae]